MVYFGVSRSRESSQNPEESTLSILHPYNEKVIAPHWNMEARFLIFLPLVAFDENGQVGSCPDLQNVGRIRRISSHPVEKWGHRAGNAPGDGRNRKGNSYTRDTQSSSDLHHTGRRPADEAAVARKIGADRKLHSGRGPGLARGSTSAVLARGYKPRASGEPKARPLTRTASSSSTSKAVRATASGPSATSSCSRRTSAPSS